MNRSVLLAVALVGCHCPTSAEPVEEAPQPGTAAYCSDACDYAARYTCVQVAGSAACDNDPRNFVRVGGTYVLSCADAMPAACGGPFGQSTCSAGCRGER
jgi:hypothetical protein